MALRFLLNGELRLEDGVPPTMTVLDWLRTRARLTGTKEGCAEGDCGACTIVLAREEDGRPHYEAVNSCLMMVPQLDGRTVLTIEGLAPPDGPLHPVQQAMMDADATQCGFCTPGFVMAMFAFREGGEPADDDRIHEALAGNLCRCTGYRSIVDACRAAIGTAGKLQSQPIERLRHAIQEDATEVRHEYIHGAQVFLAPRTLDDLLTMRAEHPDAILLAGATDLGLRVSKAREALPTVISTAAVRELKRIAADANALEIGSAVSYTEALPHLDRYFPAFGALVRRIGSRQIRNLGTLAGNIATASPIGDTLPCLIALEATVTLRSRQHARTMPVESFVTGYRTTALASDEVIASICIPFAAAGQNFAAYKVSKRFDQDISTVVAAFRLTLQNSRVTNLRAVYGGMAPRPARAAGVEAAIRGRAWTQESLVDIDTLLARDFTPISDQRGGAAYRLRAAAGLLRRFQLETASSDIPTRVEAL
ncbi:MAG TPA: xanthine dehydrogenase small subunit [Xanthobacteraceae bacterium]|nr:xanthine dehydrogenase small subunit [Xanthobacteraceae bacterium]